MSTTRRGPNIRNGYRTIRRWSEILVHTSHSPPSTNSPSSCSGGWYTRRFGNHRLRSLPELCGRDGDPGKNGRIPYTQRQRQRNPITFSLSPRRRGGGIVSAPARSHLLWHGSSPRLQTTKNVHNQASTTNHICGVLSSLESDNLRLAIDTAVAPFCATAFKLRGVQSSSGK